MKFYLKSKDEVLKEINATEDGLSSQEASKRQEKQGKNKLQEAKKDGLFKRIITSLMDPMILMLLAAAIISAVTAVIQNESFTDLFIILFVVAINTALSLIQESKAEGAIESLMEMTAATSKVLRDGKITQVKSEDLVVGDVIVLEAGDAIPADCRILESYSMKVEEAAITGESVPVTKIMDIIMLQENALDISLGDRTNMLYSGSTVVYGRGKAVVTNIGMDTEMGKIASALSTSEKEQTPLQKKMAELSKTLTKIVIAICVFVFVFGIIRSGSFTGAVILDTFLIAIALAVAAIPEGLPAVVTIVLSIGVTAMAKRQALMRKLTAVETLGCTQIICSDKTGTLTQNKMTVVDQWTPDKMLIAKAMALCSDAEIEKGAKESKGEPTEAALVNFANTLELPKYELVEKAPRIGEAPFDSGRKMMSTVHKSEEGIIQYTKGACEMLIERCTAYLNENNEVVPMNDNFKNELKVQIKSFADKAYRTLGAAYRKYDVAPTDFSPEALENDLVFIGFVGMIDPCRPEVYDAIKECRGAGIRPIMITGDHKDTAVAIGKDLGIVTDASQAMTGQDIEQMSDEQLIEAVKKCSIFARVQPEHKTRIVKALKSQNLITAMTGDGVNDAPSIKAADIGISMGITGTDVTKGASDMVLADDNFATIVNAVEEGRKIYDNIRKVLQFQLSTNMAEVVAVFTASVLGINVLSPAHLLWINMVTDTAPGLALGMEKAEGDLMRRKPRSSKDGVFSGGAGVDMVIQGLYMGILIILSFFVGQYMELGHIGIFESVDGVSMAFLTANFVELFHATCMRSQRGSIFKMKTINKWLIGAFLFTTIINIGVIYIPFLTGLFELTTISILEFFVAFALAFSVVPVLETIKFIQRRRQNERRVEVR